MSRDGLLYSWRSTNTEFRIMELLRLTVSWILLSSWQSLVWAIPIDNGLIGTPTIECGPDEFIVHFKTEKPFQGNVYAKGFFDSDNCKVGATQSTDVSIKLKYNTLANCGVRRRRMTNPRGMSVEDTVVIMFHPMFLTKIDRAFRIECMYMEGAKILTQGIDVSMLTTQELSNQSEMPTCKYEVLAEGPDGAPVKFAHIGDKVYHKWTCETNNGETHCMTVHSCSVDDGQGVSRVLLDENGCSQDRYLLQNLEYQGASQAGQEAHVFKFADRPTLYFSCQIKMMPLIGDNCVRTADNCADPAAFGGSAPSTSQIQNNNNQGTNNRPGISYTNPGVGGSSGGGGSNTAYRQALGALVETIQPFPTPDELPVEPGRIRRLQRQPENDTTTLTILNRNRYSFSTPLVVEDPSVKDRHSAKHEAMVNLSIQDQEGADEYVLVAGTQPGKALRHFNPLTDSTRKNTSPIIRHKRSSATKFTSFQDSDNIPVSDPSHGRPSIFDLAAHELEIDMDVVSDGITVLDILDSAKSEPQTDANGNFIGINRQPTNLSVVQISSANFGLLMFSLVFLMMTTAASTVFAMYTRCRLAPKIPPRNERIS